MKILTLTLAILLSAASLMLAGCQSSERTAYVAIGAVGAAADAAIGAYNDYRKTHDVPTAQVKQVRHAVQVYVNAVEAVKTAKHAHAAAVKAQLPKAEANLEIALRMLEAVSADLITLINSITQN